MSHLQEEKLDKTRRRRSCLGCGDAQEYSINGKAPSYIAWVKSHAGCADLCKDGALAVPIAAPEPLSAFPAPSAPLDGYDRFRDSGEYALLEAIQSAPGGRERMEALRQSGASHDELREAIRELWRDKSALTPRTGQKFAVVIDGGPCPRFCCGDYRFAGPALSGEVRRLFAIPYPGSGSVMRKEAACG